MYQAECAPKWVRGAVVYVPGFGRQSITLTYLPQFHLPVDDHHRPPHCGCGCQWHQGCVAACPEMICACADLPAQTSTLRVRPLFASVCWALSDLFRLSAACYQIPIGIQVSLRCCRHNLVRALTRVAQFIWAFILGIGLILLPESPRWLIMKGKEDKAQRSLSRLLQQPVESEAVTVSHPHLYPQLNRH